MPTTTDTPTTTEYLSASQEAGEQFLKAVKDAQERSLDAITSMVESINSAVESSPIEPPSFPSGLTPDPVAAAEVYYNFAEKLLEAQKSYALRLANVFQTQPKKSTAKK